MFLLCSSKPKSKIATIMGHIVKKAVYSTCITYCNIDKCFKIILLWNRIQHVQLKPKICIPLIDLYPVCVLFLFFCFFEVGAIGNSSRPQRQDMGNCTINVFFEALKLCSPYKEHWSSGPRPVKLCSNQILFRYIK